MMNHNPPYSYPTAGNYPAPHYSAPMNQPYLNQTVPTTHYPPPNPRFPMSTPKSEKRKQEILICDACGIEVNSQQMMDVHIKGQKHIKKMKLKAVAVTTTTPTTEPSNEASTTGPESTSTASNESKASPNPQEKGVLQQINELAKFHKVVAKYDLIKESGPAHSKVFEVRLSLAEEIYNGTGTSIKRAQQMAAEQALAATALKKLDAAPRGNQNNRMVRPTNATAHQTPPPARLPQGPVPMRPRIVPPRLAMKPVPQDKFNEILLKRCAEITEDERVIETLNICLDDIERALKNVSDKLMSMCQANNTRVTPQLPDDVKFNHSEETNEDSSESFRMLKGLMKVSVLSMNLHLKTDSLYSIVIVCANKPNLTLLSDIDQELGVALNTQAVSAIQLDGNAEESAPITYKVETPMDQACLHVECSRLPNHVIQVMLTSPVFRAENYLDLNEELREKIEEYNPDPLDMLDKDKCLFAAAEIRHSYWFTHCMMRNQTNLIVLRLLRDLQNQQTPLSLLSLWSLILLVHKCQAHPIESITELFRLAFACLSSGLLLAGALGPGLIDPCEKDLIDATDYLSIDERLAITHYAQTVLRLIAFEQYDQLFPSAIPSMEETDNSPE